jgi:hypothetical protein
MIAIKRLILRVLLFVLEKLGLLGRFQLATSAYLHKMGWFESNRTGMPVDSEGKPIPWITYSALFFLQQRIRPEMEIFEYSCGNSTLWWSSRVKSVTSCEHDRQWFERMKGLVPSNVALHHIALEYGGLYSEKIKEYSNLFDVIVLDGRDRVNCAKNCLPALKADGVIIWDNSDRDDYDEGYAFLLANGFRRLDFSGMGAVTIVDWCTSVFYRDTNGFGI